MCTIWGQCDNVYFQLQQYCVQRRQIYAAHVLLNTQRIMTLIKDANRELVVVVNYSVKEKTHSQ